MLRITFSNRLEPLLNKLAATLSQSGGDPFAVDQVITPNAAARTKIQLELAKRYGVCSNVEFVQLSRWMSRQLTELARPEGDIFSGGPQTWSILSAFRDLTFLEPHLRLKEYLNGADAVMRYDFAASVAALFELYMVYRPEWLVSWQAGKQVQVTGTSSAWTADQAWQAALWQHITAEAGDREVGQAAALYRLLASGKISVHPVEARSVSVFCLPSMPPLYIEVLREIGKQVDIDLYVLNPCREYWFEVVNPRYLSYLTAKGKSDYQEIGHKLLATWAKQAQSSIDLLLSSGEGVEVREAFEPHDGETLLALLQNSILDLEEIAPGTLTIPEADCSIQIHACHSLAREVEVLHDQLLALFSEEGAPAPADVLIVVPDIDAAAPIIDAVFSCAQGSRYIPYFVSGRSASKANPVALALLDVLKTVDSRLRVSDVFSLLQHPAIAAQFRLSEADLDLIMEWMIEAGIHWASDGKHRATYKVPSCEDHTFGAGFHRLFMGYALPEGSSAIFNDCVPAGNIEGSDAATLGKFWQFFEQLEKVRQAVMEERHAEAWSELLLKLLDDFITIPPKEIELVNEVRDAIQALLRDMKEGGFAATVPLSVITVALTVKLDQRSGASLPSGAVTFSSMTAMRPLTYPVVCMIGMNDGDYPTVHRPCEYDLMVHDPRKGDRQRRLDQRNIFFDLILGARRKLYISYRSRSILDNSILPPSVLVSDLVDYLIDGLAKPEEGEDARRMARRRLVFDHPLQPFSDTYFSAKAGKHLVSFNDEFCQALRSKLAAPVKLPSLAENQGDSDSDDDEAPARSASLAFFAVPLATYTATNSISIDQLSRFFSNPSRYLLQERLRISLSDEPPRLVDDEPFAAGWQASGRLAKRLLPLLRAGHSIDELYDLAVCTLDYPRGTVGKKELAKELDALKSYFETLQEEECEILLPAHSASLTINVNGSTWNVHGAFANVRSGGQLLTRYRNAHPVDFLKAWISHLFLSATHEDRFTPRTVWVARDGSFTLKPCDSAKHHLAQLVQLYQLGMHRPLHFFPKSAWQYMKKDRSIGEAQKTWCSTSYMRGEDSDPAYQLALRGHENPLDEEFKQCAVTVYEPFIEHHEGLSV